MKMSLTKLLIIVIWVPSLILISISGYFLYQNFQKYNQLQTSMKYLELTKKIENILVYLGQERGTSSIYSVSKGNYPNSKNILISKRALMDNAIKEFKSFITRNPEFYSLTKEAINIINILPATRQNIDSFKHNYIKNEFFNYYTKLSTVLINIIGNTIKNLPIEVQKEYIKKLQLEKMIDYSGIIRGFGSYYVTADAPMSEKEYKNVLLKYYHDNNILLKEVLHSKIQAIFNTKEYLNIEKEIKELLFYINQTNQQYYLTGEFDGYPIDALDYFNLFTKRIAYYKKITDFINTNINNSVNQIINNTVQNRNLNIIIFIIAIIVLLIGIYIQKTILKHINSLSHLLSSLAPIIGKKIKIDISSPKGMGEAINTVEEAIKITQESVKKAKEATKAKSLFLANMSHEIRTPLNGILGFLELLNTTDLTEEQLDYVNTISQSAKNLLQIVNNILDVSKIESNKVSLEIIEFKAIDEFENTIELFATPAAQKNIIYTAQVSPNIPYIIKGDILKIKDILTNLLNNAIKFTPNNGHINVKIQLKEFVNNQIKLYFEVKDTGIGMSEEQREKVFEAFAQADESVTRKYGGTGLGLTIVKSYVEMMGGEIKIESELNKGTKFYFELLFDVVDPKPKYSQNILSNKELALLNTLINTPRKDITLEYLSYFGIKKIGFNQIEDLQHLNKVEHLDGIVIFYDESDKPIIEMLENINIPTIFVTSYNKKEEISKYNYNTTIFDPTLPSKIVKAIESIQKTIPTKKTVKQSEKKDIYSLKALIAEDNPINQKLLQTTLNRLGIESDIANNGLEVFNKYSMSPEKYDVIFMDVQMPIMDGIEATQEILEFEKEDNIPHTPIIAVTANVLKGDRERFLGAGMDEYISKPISKEALLKILERIANGEFNKNYSEESEIKTKEQHSYKKETEKNIILLSKSPFLESYFKTIVPEINSITSLDEFTSFIMNNKDSLIIIDESFEENESIKILIKSIKKLLDAKIVVITEQEIKEADATIVDLKPESIIKTIKEVNNE